VKVQLDSGSGFYYPNRLHHRIRYTVHTLSAHRNS
jgi:hypothetical protein